MTEPYLADTLDSFPPQVVALPLSQTEERDEHTSPTVSLDDLLRPGIGRLLAAPNIPDADGSSG